MSLCWGVFYRGCIQVTNPWNADCSPITIKELSQNQLPKLIRNFEYSSFNRFKNRIRSLAGKWVFDISLTFPSEVRNHCSYISKMKMFSILHQANSLILWMKGKGKPLTQRKEQVIKYFCIFETTWTQDQSVGKDTWSSFWMFLPSFSY